MIIKKLLVPFINEKILQNAEHCYIAAAAISEPGFDFLMSRIGPKCKVDIVTGLDVPTQPEVLIKALRNYPGKVIFRIYTKNFFHPDVYIFDLPFRKVVAFVSSAHFSIAGIRDNEELSYKTDNEKIVEELKSLFRSYSESGEDLSERIISEYEKLYPSIAKRDAESRREKREFLDFVTSGFSWERAGMKNQFFQEEDYKVFESHKQKENSQLVQFERSRLREKFENLHEQLEPVAEKLKLTSYSDNDQNISSSDPARHYENKVKGMWLSYGRKKEEGGDSLAEIQFLLRFIIRVNDAGIWLISESGKNQNREKFRNEMQQELYRKKFFDQLKALGEEFWIEIAGEKKKVTAFKTPEQLIEFTSQDREYFPFIIGRTYLPDHPDLSSSKIIPAIQTELTRLQALCNELMN